MYEVKRDFCLEFRHWTYSLAPFISTLHSCTVQRFGAAPMDTTALGNLHYFVGLNNFQQSQTHNTWLHCIFAGQCFTAYSSLSEPKPEPQHTTRNIILRLGNKDIILLLKYRSIFNYATKDTPKKKKLKSNRVKCLRAWNSFS